MDALKRRGNGRKRAMLGKQAWVAAAVIVTAVGCKMGNPLDRTVKVTQQPSQDPLDLPSPQTRLASGSLQRTPNSSVAQASFTTTSEPSPHEPGARNGSETRKTVAHKTPATSAPGVSKTQTKRSTTESTATAHLASPAAPLDLTELPAEHAALLEAFRDSPPEVQQQALRQLIAVSGHSAPKTHSPASITAALQSSVDNLPKLPEDAEEPTSLPARLGAGDAPAVPANALVQDVSDSDVDSVSQAPIALASSTSPASPGPPAVAIEPQQNAKTALPPPVATTSVSAEPMKSMTDTQLYTELAQRLGHAAPGESEADAYRRQIIARHLMMFAGNPDGAVAAFEGMKKSEQDFLRHHLLGVWAMIDTNGHPVAARRWSAALPEMRQATQQLSASAESLEIRSLAFCKEIQSFGQITPFESSRFEAGQKVILYCEIDNFLAQSTADGFETHLQGSYEIFDAKNQKVAGQVLPADKQLCASYLRDYFIAYQMNLPASLNAGEYRLELTMECLKGQKYGQASIPLSIARPAAVSR